MGHPLLNGPHTAQSPQAMWLGPPRPHQLGGSCQWQASRRAACTHQPLPTPATAPHGKDPGGWPGSSGHLRPHEGRELGKGAHALALGPPARAWQQHGGLGCWPSV